MKALCRYLLIVGAFTCTHVQAGTLLDLQTPVFMRQVEATYGAQGRDRVGGWFDLLARRQTLSEEPVEKVLASINNYFNLTPWLSDQEHWGVTDYWATPVETLGSNGGDCEDFAIGKFFSLKSIPFDEEKLRITYVKSIAYNQAHMVLAYYPTPDAEPLILDNINKTVLPASQRTDLIPVYSFNGESIWLAKSRAKKLDADSQKSLPKWKDLNQRMGQMRQKSL